MAWNINVGTSKKLSQNGGAVDDMIYPHSGIASADKNVTVNGTKSPAKQRLAQKNIQHDVMTFKNNHDVMTLKKTKLDIVTPKNNQNDVIDAVSKVTKTSKINKDETTKIISKTTSSKKMASMQRQ